jgi:hypothetical protein
MGIELFWIEAVINSNIHRKTNALLIFADPGEA